MIFDWDGVLVDSEPIAIRLFSAVRGELGLTDIEEEWLRQCVGLAMPAWVARIEGRLGRPVPLGFASEFYVRLDSALRR